MLNQRRLTTGMNPSPDELEALRMAELESAYNAKAQQRAYNIQERSLAQQATQYAASNALNQQSINNQASQAQNTADLQRMLGLASIQQAQDAASSSKTASLISSGVQAPMSGLSMYNLFKSSGKTAANVPQVVPGTSSTTIPISSVPDFSSTAASNPFTQIPVATSTTNPMSGMSSYGTNLPSDLASVYEGGSQGIGGLSETGSVADTATGLSYLGDATEVGSTIPEYGGIYTGIGGAGETATGAAGGTASSLGGTFSAVSSAMPWIGAALTARSLIDPLLPASAQGGVENDVNTAFDVYGDALDSHGNLIGHNLWASSMMLGAEKPAQQLGNWITGTLGETATQAIDPIGALATGADVGDVAKSVLDPIGITDSGETVICTELHRQGLLDDEAYAADSSFGRTLPQEVMAGYQSWGIPIARAMRASRIVTRMVRCLTHHTIKEMAHRSNPTRNGSAIGSTVLTVGIPICGFIGRFMKKSEVCYG